MFINVVSPVQMLSIFVWYLALVPCVSILCNEDIMNVPSSRDSWPYDMPSLPPILNDAVLSVRFPKDLYRLGRESYVRILEILGQSTAAESNTPAGASDKSEL